VSYKRPIFCHYRIFSTPRGHFDPWKNIQFNSIQSTLHLTIPMSRLLQVNPEARKGASLPRIDTLPEELAAQIVDQVRSWTTLVEDEVENDVVRRWVISPFCFLQSMVPLFPQLTCLRLHSQPRSRDSTLRALAMTSRLGYQSYYPSLIRNLCLCPSLLTPFSQVLERNMDSGPQVKSLTLDRGTLSGNQVSIPLSQLDSLVSSSSNQ